MTDKSCAAEPIGMPTDRVKQDRDVAAKSVKIDFFFFLELLFEGFLSAIIHIGAAKMKEDSV